jgi:hypothetical protein
MTARKRVLRAKKRRRLTSHAAADAVVTSLTLPRSLHERARVTALRLNWSFAELARAALAEWLAAHEPKKADR